MKRITIVGGGLAGLALGLLLRQREVPVTLFDAGRYPRHRVCGEFISGRGAEVLNRLNVLSPNQVRLATTAAFFSSKQCMGERTLPAPALCVSRYALDRCLAARFQELGGELIANERWAGEEREAVVLANGRRRHAAVDGWRWFGLKAHFRDVALQADLEMHLSPNAYVGLCRLPDDVVNACGLFRVPERRHEANESARLPEAGALTVLRGVPGTKLHARLGGAGVDHRSVCSVAGLSLRPEPVSATACRIGDAFTMIPPITGNGMSMAFESAALACGALVSYARNERSWAETTSAIAAQLQGEFSRRLSWASFLQRVLFSRASIPATRACFAVEPLWRASFAITR
jgi:menaquinone-9 beta-reductase